MRASTVLVAVILIVTFPIWIGIIAGLFGMIIGLIGGAFGIVAGVFGAVFGGIAAAFGSLFEVLFGWHWFPHFHLNGFGLLAIILVIALLIRSRQRK